MRVPLHRTETGLMICITEIVTSIYSFVTFQADDAQMPICCAGQAPTCHPADKMARFYAISKLTGSDG